MEEGKDNWSAPAWDLPGVEVDRGFVGTLSFHIARIFTSYSDDLQPFYGGGLLSLNIRTESVSLTPRRWSTTEPKRECWVKFPSLHPLLLGRSRGGVGEGRKGLSEEPGQWMRTEDHGGEGNLSGSELGCRRAQRLTNPGIFKVSLELGLPGERSKREGGWELSRFVSGPMGVHFLL